MVPALLISFVLLLAAVVFSMQNSAPLTVQILFWERTTSLATIIWYAFIAGAACALALTLPKLARKYRQNRRLCKHLAEHEQHASPA